MKYTLPPLAVWKQSTVAPAIMILLETLACCFFAFTLGGASMWTTLKIMLCLCPCEELLAECDVAVQKCFSREDLDSKCRISSCQIMIYEVQEDHFTLSSTTAHSSLLFFFGVPQQL